MARLTLNLLRRANAINPQLVPLLKATRSLQLAIAELRWIKQELPRSQWTDAIRKRAQLVPLQYILGSQPFGSLDILCSPGVLIPRWETEEWCMKLVDVLRSAAVSDISVLDACTGSGCIPLLLKKELPALQVLAVDLSDKALHLALENMRRANVTIDVQKVDVLNYNAVPEQRFTLVTSNPPYIPASDFDKPLLLNGVDASVRLHEPRMALVGHLEFYRALARDIVPACHSEGVVLELGYEDQYLETIANLPLNWSHGRYFDLAGNLRCAIAWKNGSSMECLGRLVNENQSHP
ncbi:hypothetical protein PUMCH_004471 [Australozyma saopauloensis]|uniref:peptide chain release factor N(5)-glutamine methyltransferase n=1 Tax=Australozyma saopauloensis TaxID=291208 RepID=A0AAX4HER1_9ASCO|nr:hypothetical protein PUMCH_004471 [[Candida] saopauloensis]